MLGRERRGGTSWHNVLMPIGLRRLRGVGCTKRGASIIRSMVALLHKIKENKAATRWRRIAISLRLFSGSLAFVVLSNNIACFPDAHMVEMVEKQMTRQREKRWEETR